MSEEYIKRDAAIDSVKAEMKYRGGTLDYNAGLLRATENLEILPAADVVEEENILKFYYVRSIDEYWIGQRIDNFYYAEYDPKSRQWVWTHSRYLPWGEHIVSPTSLWKEHTYPSEPEEIPFAEWLQGFIKKHAADVVAVRHGRWEEWWPGDCALIMTGEEMLWMCSECTAKFSGRSAYCPNCGARMDGGVNDGQCDR